MNQGSPDVIAKGEYYFDNPLYPLTVRRVKASAADPATHEHDLTEIRHRHDFCELALITQGRAMHWLEGEAFPVAAGDVFVLSGEQSHYFYDRKRLETINIMYDPAQLELPENRLGKIPGYRALFLLEPRLRQQRRFNSHLRLGRADLAPCERIAREMEQEVTTKRAGYEVAMYGKFIELVVNLSRLYQESPTTNAEALLRVAKVIDCIEERYAEPWKIDDFAALAHMSRSTFMRVFRTATGQTPNNYLLQVRIQRSSAKLCGSKLPVSQIAYDVGFNDSNYFTRQFKRLQGISPAAYRKAHRT